jgi:hypothetical protein
VIGDECQVFEDCLSLVALDVICLAAGGMQQHEGMITTTNLINRIRTLS